MTELVRGGTTGSILERARWEARDRLRRSPLIRRAVLARRHRELVPEDAFIASFPRSGNTWLRFVLADLATGGAVDFEGVERVIPNVGFHRDAVRYAGAGRLIKTHEAYRGDYQRGIYLVRDFRDVLISWYRVTRDDPDDTSQLDAVVEQFVTPLATPYGAWHEHVRSWLAGARLHAGVKVHRFEDLRADPVAGVSELAGSLELESSPERVREAIERNGPDEMRRHELVNKDFLQRSFGRMSRGVREGAAGKWQDLLEPHHLRVLEPAVRLAAELGYDV